MSLVLYDMINSRAKLSFDSEIINASNFNLWISHWFKTAYLLQCEFTNENLTETAKAIDNIINEQHKLCGYYAEKGLTL